MGKNSLKEINRIAGILKKSLSKKGIEVRDIFLFGSHARGENLKTSDVDLIVVSDNWAEVPFLERLDMVNEIIWEEKLGNVEAIPVTTRELEERTSMILRDAEKYWVRLY